MTAEGEAVVLGKVGSDYDIRIDLPWPGEEVRPVNQ